ncbi:MAG: response regulator [Deltaproteobacteria bacterium]|nr:response regulator [Deltaproteobacteria bacterium]
MAGAILPEKILFVDDEPEVLNSFRRQLRGKFNLAFAQGGEQGLATLAAEGPFAVVVSDLRMPGMNGITFLGRVLQTAPDTVRMMLTGFADAEAAIAAVNEGNIFRFLTKPCPDDQLLKALVAAIKQHRLVRAERELLEQTLQGSIKVLTEILGLVNPAAFGRASRIAHYVRELGKVLDHPSPWELESAALLSQIGCLTLPEDLLHKVLKGEALSREEKKFYREHPALASELIRTIPRMEEVSRLVALQEKGFDGSGAPVGGPSGEDLPLGARILKVVLDFDALTFSGHSKGRTLGLLKAAAQLYDPGVLIALEMVLGREAHVDLREARVKELNPTMRLAEDVLSRDGKRRLLAKGQHLTATLIMTVRNYHSALGVAEPIKVEVPLTATPAPGAGEAS